MGQNLVQCARVDNTCNHTARRPRAPSVSGPVVQLTYATGMQARAGALAEIVDGPSCFPELFVELHRRLGDPADVAGFVWVRWLQSDARWSGQPDGAYAVARFKRR